MTRHRAGGAPPTPGRPARCLPDPWPTEVAQYQAMARDWLWMWSPWRRAWTAVARFGARPLILDDPNPHELLRQCRAAELAVASRRRA